MATNTYLNLPLGIISFPIPVSQGGTGTTNRTLTRSNGNVSVDWQSCLLKDVNGITSEDYSSRFLAGSNTLIRYNWETGAFSTNTGNPSLSINSKFLEFDSGSISVAWNQGNLIDSDGGVVFDWLNNFWNFSIASGGGVFIDANNQYIYDISGNLAFDIGSRILCDFNGATSINVADGLYYYNTIPVLDLGNKALSDEAGNFAFIFTAANRTLYAAGLKAVINLNTSVLYDNAVNTSLNWKTRIAYANDGTTAAINYDSPSGIALSNGVTSNKGVSTAGFGIPIVFGDVSLTGQSTSLGPTTIVASGAGGLFEAKVYLVTTTTGGGTVAVAIKYTDDSNTVQTVNPLPISTISLAGSAYGTGASGGNLVFAAKNSTNIQYTTTVAGLTGSPRYELKIVITKVQ